MKISIKLLEPLMALILGMLIGLILVGAVASAWMGFGAITQHVEKPPIEPVVTSKLKAVDCTVTKVEGLKVYLSCLELPLPPSRN